MPIGPWHSLASVASNCPKNVTWISCSARQGPSRSGLPLDHISTQSLPALVVLLPLARAKLTSAPRAFALALPLPGLFVFQSGCACSPHVILLSACLPPPQRSSPATPSNFPSYHPALPLHSILLFGSSFFSALALCFDVCFLEQTAVLCRTVYMVSTQQHSLSRINLSE